MSFHPYLNFGGNCREAFTRYQQIFGGELEILSFSDMPMDPPMPAEMGALVAHAALTIGEHVLMASDDPADTFTPAATPAAGMWSNFTTSDPGEAARVFAALADGGEVVMPFGDTEWSPAFGMCVDRFGIPWMVNTDAE